MLFHENGSSDVPHVILNESFVQAHLILLTFVRVKNYSIRVYSSQLLGDLFFR